MSDLIVEEERGSYGGGHIRLHRSFLESTIWKMGTSTTILAIYLLLRANWKDNTWFDKWQNKRILIRRGELVTSQDGMAKGAGLSRQQVRTALRYLVADGFIELLNNSEKSTKQHTHLKIIKYNTYQYDSNSSQPTSNQGLTNDQPTSNQPLTTNEERKESKKEKNKYICPKFAQFWGLYRKPVEKPAAYAEWKKLTEESKDSAIKTLSNGYPWPEKRFIPHPAKWLKLEKWNDVHYPERKYKDSTYDPSSPDYMDEFERLAKSGEKH